MDYLDGNIKTLYRKYLIASMGSALVMSIYSFVDTIAVGQSEGPLGTAAMAVITPFYGVMVFLAILCGIGGSVLMTSARGEGNEDKGNAYFTAALILMAALTAVFWLAFALFHDQIFLLFGADETILPKVMEYAELLIWFFPVFLAPVFVSAFIRNDGAPGLAMAAVVAGGCVNVLGDWFLVFPMGMGMRGAALATVCGTSLQVFIMCSHFWSRRCHLKLSRPFQLGRAVRRILQIGVGSSILDLGTVILAILMNNQIMRYGGATELSVYGVAATIASLFQALFCGVGQAVQPLVSANFGAGKTERIRSVLRMSMLTVLVMGVLFTALGELLPVQITRLFTAATPEVIAAAPTIYRLYFLLFPPLGVTVLATYYLQSVMQDRRSMLIAVLRSAVVSGALLLLLPLMLDINGVWLAMPLSELLVAALALFFLYGRRARQA